LTADSAAAASDGSPSGKSWLRWWVAIVVALIAVVAYVHGVSTQTDCKHVIASHAGAPTVVQVCGPPSLLDLVPYFLVIGLLLWPDLSEFGVGGVVTLKRMVQRQSERQDAIEQRLVVVDQHLMQLSMVAQTQSTSVTNNYYAPDQADLGRGIEEKRPVAEEQLVGGTAPAESAVSVPTPPASDTETDEHQRLLGEFLNEYATLEPYITPRRGDRRVGEGWDALLESTTLERYRTLFADELGALRQTRNVAVHEPQTVSNETLVGAIRNTRTLLEILKKGFEVAGDAPEEPGLDRP